MALWLLLMDEGVTQRSGLPAVRPPAYGEVKAGDRSDDESRRSPTGRGLHRELRNREVVDEARDEVK